MHTKCLNCEDLVSCATSDTLFNCGVIVFDDNFKITFANEKIFSFLKRKKNDVLGSKLDFYFDSRYWENCKTDLEKQKKRPCKKYYDLFLKTGEQLEEEHFTLGVRTLFDQVGRFKEYRAFVFPDLLHCLKEDGFHPKAKLEFERYQFLVEKTFDWVWELNFNFEYIYSNRQVESILGYPVDKILGKCPYDFMTHEDRTKVVELVNKMIREPFELKPIIRHFLTKTGETRYIESAGVPIRNSEGRFMGLRGISRDITERYLYFKKTQEDSILLKDLVQQKTQQLIFTTKNLHQILLENKDYVRKIEHYNFSLKQVVTIVKEKEREIYEDLISKVNKNIYPLLSQLPKNEKTERVINLIRKQFETHFAHDSNVSLSVKHNFTPAETEVALMVARGSSSKDIAHSLSLSVFTVNNHIRHIRQKLGIARSTNLKTFLKEQNI